MIKVTADDLLHSEIVNAKIKVECELRGQINYAKTIIDTLESPGYNEAKIIKCINNLAYIQNSDYLVNERFSEELAIRSLTEYVAYLEQLNTRVSVY